MFRVLLVGPLIGPLMLHEQDGRGGDMDQAHGSDEHQYRTEIGDHGVDSRHDPPEPRARGQQDYPGSAKLPAIRCMERQAHVRVNRCGQRQCDECEQGQRLHAGHVLRIDTLNLAAVRRTTSAPRRFRQRGGTRIVGLSLQAAGPLQDRFRIPERFHGECMRTALQGCGAKAQATVGEIILPQVFRVGNRTGGR